MSMDAIQILFPDINRKDLEKVIECTSSKIEIDKDIAMKAITEMFSSQYLLSRVNEKFNLTQIENDTLKSYIEFMHPTRRVPFIKRVLESPREYIDPILDTELEEFGEETFNISY